LAAGGETRTDREIIALCRSGAAEGYDALVAAHSSYLLSFCWRITGDRTEAEDAVQEVFLRLVRSLPKLDPQPSLRPWLRRVAANVCISEARRRSRGPVLGADDAAVAAEFEAPGLAGADPVAGQVLERADVAAVGRAINSLSRPQRAVLIMRVVDGLGYESIAAALGLPVGTVKSHLARARAQLRLAIAN
jgi:RNA polymerase sigma-70 factor (ECF subfamily)